MADDAVENLHRSAGENVNSCWPGASAVEEKPIERDRVRCRDVDGDSGIVDIRLRNPTEPVRLNTDSLGNGQRSVAGRIEHVDLAVGRGDVVGVLEGPKAISVVRNTMGATSGPAYAGSSTVDGPHGWEPDDVIFFTLNPISESVYPYSRIVQLYSAAILEDTMMAFISERFTDSNIPYGVMDLGEVTERELLLAIDNWNAQATSGNRILMTGSKGSGTKWLPFGYHLKDLEATGLLQ